MIAEANKSWKEENVDMVNVEVLLPIHESTPSIWMKIMYSLTNETPALIQLQRTVYLPNQWGGEVNLNTESNEEILLLLDNKILI